MEKLIVFLDNYEGRDKILKLFQYLGRFLKATFPNNYSIRFMNLSYGAFYSRKIFRLGKSLNEINNVMKTIRRENYDTLTKILDILIYVSLGVRWFFDNLSILSSYNILSLNTRELTKFATTAWMVGLVSNLTKCSSEMMKSYAKEAMLKETSVGKTTKWVIDNLDGLSQIRRKMIMEIAKIIGDLIIASNGAQIPYRVLGKQFSEKWVGIGGMVSSAISIFEVWKIN